MEKHLHNTVTMDTVQQQLLSLWAMETDACRSFNELHKRKNKDGRGESADGRAPRQRDNTWNKTHKLYRSVSADYVLTGWKVGHVKGRLICSNIVVTEQLGCNWVWCFTQMAGERERGEMGEVFTLLESEESCVPVGGRSETSPAFKMTDN